MTNFFKQRFIQHLGWAVVGIMLLISAACQYSGAKPSVPHEILYVGTYSVRNSKGLYAYRFDRRDTTFELVQTTTGPDSPTFLAISPDGRFLYSANRQGIPGDTLNGSVSAYPVDTTSGKLLPLHTTSSHGISPCHINTDGRWLYLSHYVGGSITVLPLNDDGSIGPLFDTIQHRGNSVHPERQQSPHVHSIQPLPDADYFVAADLGTDQLNFYTIGAARISPAPFQAIQSNAGAGPRHFTFSNDPLRLYVAEELSSTVSVYELDITGAEARLVQRRSTLPPDFDADNTVADIHLSPDDRFLYVSNRGHNSLAIFAVEPTDGRLSPLGHQPTLGETPRNFLLDPQGAFVLVANQDSDEIVYFARNSDTGLLWPTDRRLQLPSPVSLQWLLIKS